MARSWPMTAERGSTIRTAAPPPGGRRNTSSSGGGGVDPDDPPGVPSGEEARYPSRTARWKSRTPARAGPGACRALGCGRTLLGRQVEQERQAGGRAPRRIVQPLHQRSVEPPRLRLVRRSRVAEAVAQDGPAGQERRKDEPADVLRPRRLVEEKFGFRGRRFPRGGRSTSPRISSARGAAGLAGDEVKDPFRRGGPRAAGSASSCRSLDPQTLRNP